MRVLILFKKKLWPSWSKQKCLCQKKFKSENTNKKVVLKNIHSIKGSEESSTNVCGADLKDSLGKLEKKNNNFWCLRLLLLIVAIMKLCLFNSLGS